MAQNNTDVLLSRADVYVARLGSLVIPTTSYVAAKTYIDANASFTQFMQSESVEFAVDYANKDRF
jgi:hypothetical protein